MVSKVGQQRVWHEDEVAVTWRQRLQLGGSTIREEIPHWMPHRILLLLPWLQRWLPAEKVGVLDLRLLLVCRDYAKLESFQFLLIILSLRKWSFSTWFFYFGTRF